MNGNKKTIYEMENSVPTFSHFFLRELDKLIAEIEAFPSETSLWQVGGNVSNSAGNLALHLAGNLQHFIGAVMGGTGYVRDRDREFSVKNVPRTAVLAGLNDAKNVAKKTLDAMTDVQLTQDYPVEFKGETRSNLYALLHLYGHLDYHVGQVNYLRRIL